MYLFINFFTKLLFWNSEQMRGGHFHEEIWLNENRKQVALHDAFLTVHVLWIYTGCL